MPKILQPDVEPDPSPDVPEPDEPDPEEVTPPDEQQPEEGNGG
jgi:hypothetical protein